MTATARNAAAPPAAPALFKEWSAYLKPEDVAQLQAA